MKSRKNSLNTSAQNPKAQSAGAKNPKRAESKNIDSSVTKKAESKKAKILESKKADSKNIESGILDSSLAQISRQALHTPQTLIIKIGSSILTQDFANNKAESSAQAEFNNKAESNNKTKSSSQPAQNPNSQQTPQSAQAPQSQQIPHAREVQSQYLASLASQIAKLKEQIPNIIIVSSGAIAAGFKLLGFPTRPKDIADKQACAAVGQARLMWQYDEAFGAHGIQVAQILLTKDDLANRKRFYYARTTLERLLALGVIPIINENDSLLVDELKYIETFGDNDNLAALVAGMMDADLLLILSDVNGLYTADPSKDASARAIHEVSDIDSVLPLAKSSSSGVGTGGMNSKLNAAKKALKMGCDVAIIGGSDTSNIKRFFAKEVIGTYFKSQEGGIKKRNLWLEYATIPKGALTLDEGATIAVKSRKSLLAKGVIKCEGEFHAGEVVALLDSSGAQLGVGKARYSGAEVRKIIGKDSKEFAAILGRTLGDEVVHSNDISMSEKVARDSAKTESGKTESAKKASK
ncbi:hypothetical protein BKN38_00345 [Helicobacter sp. CLO-3]|uniref:glutamate 5-kinase n=1 Tax=unclassified Helicobacter TaxID=2593540 RepID=UPI0008D97318|nr:MULTISPECIES: glutamate 5-kinase [unclassified Helicobacter]OHU85885.1 hypothetical protein BKN38_00345 [Helicobacter sp. CLO-3]